jgi:hypothetical protein
MAFENALNGKSLFDLLLGLSMDYRKSLPKQGVKLLRRILREEENKKRN